MRRAAARDLLDVDEEVLRLVEDETEEDEDLNDEEEDEEEVMDELEGRAELEEDEVTDVMKEEDDAVELDKALDEDGSTTTEAVGVVNVVGVAVSVAFSVAGRTLCWRTKSLPREVKGGRRVEGTKEKSTDCQRLSSSPPSFFLPMHAGPLPLL